MHRSTTRRPQPPHRPPHHTAAAPVRLVLAVLLLATLAACGGGLLGGGGTGPYDRPDTDRITGEVERVEEHANEIDLWTDDRRIVTVRYLDDTPVYYQGQRYEAANLERGDVVTIQVEQTGTGAWLAERIDVDRARQDRVGEEPEGDDPFEDDYGDDETRSVEGEVRNVDLAARRIEIATRGGLETLTYSRATPVYYRGEENDVEALEPGDVIRAEVDTTREPWRVLDFITVTVARQERTDDRYGDDASWGEPEDDPWGEPGDEEGERFSGTVQQVDPQRGEFVLDTERYGLKTVVMPFNASREDREAFDRLRRGDTVRIEGQRTERDRIDLIRFGW